MNNFVKVSVIVPNYNHKSFLEQRLLSILNQTFQDFEIILLDDASTDNSETILSQYINHPRVSQVVFNKNNSGSVFKQWIRGIELAVGEFIWIAESDDFAESTFLESTVGALNVKANLGLVFTDTTKVDVHGKALGLISKSKKMLASVGDKEVLINKTNFAKYLLTHLTIVNASSVLFRKTALLTIDFNKLKDFRNTGDVFTYVGIALNFDLTFLPIPLNYMRFHSSNSTKKNKTSGQVYKDKILLFNYYLNDFTKLSSLRNDIFAFFVSFFFFSIDYGSKKELLYLIKNMYKEGFVTWNKYFKIRMILFFYQNMMYHGRPYFLREKLKEILKN